MNTFTTQELESLYRAVSVAKGEWVVRLDDMEKPEYWEKYYGFLMDDEEFPQIKANEIADTEQFIKELQDLKKKLDDLIYPNGYPI
jgi:hypothetical protein